MRQAFSVMRAGFEKPKLLDERICCTKFVDNARLFECLVVSLVPARCCSAEMK